MDLVAALLLVLSLSALYVLLLHLRRSPVPARGYCAQLIGLASIHFVSWLICVLADVLAKGLSRAVASPLLTGNLLLFCLLLLFPQVIDSFARAAAQNGWVRSVRLAAGLRSGLVWSPQARRQGEIEEALAWLRRGEAGRAEAILEALAGEPARGLPMDPATQQDLEQVRVLVDRMAGRWESVAWRVGSMMGVRRALPPQVFYAGARAYAELGMPAMAARLLKEVEALDDPREESPGGLWLARMACAFLRGDMPEGERWLARIREEDASQLPAVFGEYWLARGCIASGRWEEARAHLDKAEPLATQETLREAIGRQRAILAAAPPAAPPVAPAVSTVSAQEEGWVPDPRRVVTHRIISRMERTPRSTLVLLTLCVGVWSAMQAWGSSENEATLVVFGAKLSPLIAPERYTQDLDEAKDDGFRFEPPEYWRLVACMFLHIGTLHLFLNGLNLWVLGRLIENLLGVRSFLAVYVLSGLGASLASHLNALASNNPEVQRTLSAGASGAICGLMGAALAFGLRHRKFLPEGFRSRWLANIGFWTAVQVVVGFSVALVDNAGHLGGLVTGFAVGLVLPAEVFEKSQTPAVRKSWNRALWALTAVLIAALVYGGIGVAGSLHRHLELHAAQPGLWTASGIEEN